RSLATARGTERTRRRGMMLTISATKRDEKLLTKVMFRTVLILAIALLAFPRTDRSNSFEGDAASRPKPKVLYLTHSAGFKHAVLPFSQQTLKQVGEQSGVFEVNATEDCSLISREGLKEYKAVVFYTTGELPISEEQKAAFLAFIKAGGGFVGIHSATDTFYKWAEY